MARQLHIAVSSRSSGRRFAAVLVGEDGWSREIAGTEPALDATRLLARAAAEGLALVPEGEEVVVHVAQESVVRWGEGLAGAAPSRRSALDADLPLAGLILARRVRWRVAADDDEAFRRARRLARLPVLGEAAEPEDDAPEPVAEPLAVEPAPQRLVAYTDGGCRGNPGPGGWAFLLVDQTSGAALERAGGAPHTTNNRMEMQAAIEVLSSLKGGRRPLLIRTDSRYLMDTCTKWIPGWKRKGWRKANGDPVLNLELVQRLDELCAAHDVRWQWVEGHKGEPGNERVDLLANRAMDAVQAGRDPSWDRRYEQSPVRVRDP